MEDIEGLIGELRAVYTNLVQLQEMSGPEMLLPGRVQAYQEKLAEATASYGRVEAQIKALGQRLEAERQRLDRGVKGYGPTHRELPEL